MLDCLASHRNLPRRTLNNLPHVFSPVEDVPRLLVLVHVDLDLINQLLIHRLVLMDQPQKFIELSVQ